MRRVIPLVIIGIGILIAIIYLKNKSTRFLEKASENKCAPWQEDARILFIQLPLIFLGSKEE